MNCQKCLSDRVIKVMGHCSDMCVIKYKGKEFNGYVPSRIGIGGGDDVIIKLCLDCGQTQGKFPIDDSDLPDELLPDYKEEP